MKHGKSINIFLKDGTANGVVTAELTNWNGKAIKLPRMEVEKCDRSDIQGVGVYFLFYTDSEGNELVYIGESENVLRRIKQHLKDETYWHTVVAFIGSALDKALIRYLENRLVELAKASSEYKVITKNIFTDVILSESQVASMEEFIDNIRILTSTLGYKVLTTHESIEKDDKIFTCQKRGASAKCFISGNGFTVIAGSVISKDEAPAFIKNNYKKIRDNLIANGVIVNGIFKTDYEFESPSAASTVVIGSASDGRVDWKYNGKSMKDFLS